MEIPNFINYQLLDNLVSLLAHLPFVLFSVASHLGGWIILQKILPGSFFFFFQVAFVCVFAYNEKVIIF